MPVRIKPGGVGIYTDPAFNSPIENHASTCSHCQKITDFPSRKQMMDYVDICRGCMKLICLDCYGKPCMPYEKRVEIQENEHRIRSRIHMQAWRCY